MAMYGGLPERDDDINSKPRQSVSDRACATVMFSLYGLLYKNLFAVDDIYSRHDAVKIIDVGILHYQDSAHVVNSVFPIIINRNVGY